MHTPGKYALVDVFAGKPISAKHLLSMGMVFAHWTSNGMKPMFFV